MFLCCNVLFLNFVQPISFDSDLGLHFVVCILFDNECHQLSDDKQKSLKKTNVHAWGKTDVSNMPPLAPLAPMAPMAPLIGSNTYWLPDRSFGS